VSVPLPSQHPTADASPITRSSRSAQSEAATPARSFHSEAGSRSSPTNMWRACAMLSSEESVGFAVWSSIALIKDWRTLAAAARSRWEMPRSPRSRSRFSASNCFVGFRFLDAMPGINHRMRAASIGFVFPYRLSSRRPESGARRSTRSSPRVGSKDGTFPAWERRPRPCPGSTVPRRKPHVSPSAPAAVSPSRAAGKSCKRLRYERASSARRGQREPSRSIHRACIESPKPPRRCLL
jgi:hypothetical protein